MDLILLATTALFVFFFNVPIGPVSPPSLDPAQLPKVDTVIAAPRVKAIDRSIGPNLTPSFDSAQSGNDSTAIVDNMEQSISGVPGLVSGVAYLLGIATGVTFGAGSINRDWTTVWNPVESFSIVGRLPAWAKEAYATYLISSLVAASIRLMLGFWFLLGSFYVRFVRRLIILTWSAFVRPDKAFFKILFGTFAAVLVCLANLPTAYDAGLRVIMSVLGWFS